MSTSGKRGSACHCDESGRDLFRQQEALIASFTPKTGMSTMCSSGQENQAMALQTICFR
jgi:hypothetical protein